MAKPRNLVRESLMLEALKVKLLVQRLGVRSESEAIRTVIDDFLFASGQSTGETTGRRSQAPA